MKKIVALLLSALLMTGLVGCSVSGNVEDAKTTSVEESTDDRGESELPDDRTETAGDQSETENQQETTEEQSETEEAPESTEEQPETEKQPETEAEQAGNAGSDVGNGDYAPMTEADFNTAAANSVTTVTVNFGPEVRFYLDADFVILAVEALEWQAECILGETYVYLPMQFGEGLADVAVKGWDMLIGGLGIEQMTLTVKTQLTDMDAVISRYYDEMETMTMMSNGLVARKSHRFSN